MPAAVRFWKCHSGLDLGGELAGEGRERSAETEFRVTYSVFQAQ